MKNVSCVPVRVLVELNCRKLLFLVFHLFFGSLWRLHKAEVSNEIHTILNYFESDERKKKQIGDAENKKETNKMFSCHFHFAVMSDLQVS